MSTERSRSSTEQNEQKPSRGSSFLIENLLRSSQKCKATETKDKTDTKETGFGEDTDRQTRSRKHRTTFTDMQLHNLEKAFAETKYVSLAERQRMAQLLDMTDIQVKTWFQNRRMKYKRQHSERHLQQATPTAWRNDNFYRRLNTSSMATDMYQIYNNQRGISVHYPYKMHLGVRRSSHQQPWRWGSRQQPHSNLMATHARTTVHYN